MPIHHQLSLNDFQTWKHREVGGYEVHKPKVSLAEMNYLSNNSNNQHLRRSYNKSQNSSENKDGVRYSFSKKDKVMF